MPSGSDYEAWFYKANGDLDYTRRRDGQTIAFQFDLLGRLTQRTPPAGTDTVTYTYDLVGRRTAATISGAAARSLGWSYDKAGRVTAAAQGPRTLSYTYDSGLTWMEIVWPDALTVRYSSDKLGRTTTIAEIGGPTLATYNYDELSRRTDIAWGNGTTTGYEYNASTFRLSALGHNLAGTSADVRWDLTFNSASELRTRERNNDAYAWTNNVNQTLAYQTNGLNQYTQAGARNPTYDARGNLISSWASSFGYDADNKLIRAAGLGNVELSYDGAGRLSRNTTNGTAVDQLWDGNDLIAEYDASGNLLRRYVHGPGIDEPIVTYEGGRRWQYADPQGSIVAIADASGAPMTTTGYGPYGEPGLTNSGRFGFTGAARITGTALYDLRARAYWPNLGRFVQADPIGTQGGMNLYEYAASDPVNMTDPMGTDPLCMLCTGQYTGAGDWRPPLRTTVYGSGFSRNSGYTAGGGVGPLGGYPGLGANLGATPPGMGPPPLISRQLAMRQKSQGTTSSPAKRQSCAGEMTSYIGSARLILSGTADLTGLASVGLAAGGVTAPVAVATKLLNTGAQGSLLALNLYDWQINGNWASLAAQGAAFAVDPLGIKGAARLYGLASRRGALGSSLVGQFLAQGVGNATCQVMGATQ